MNDVIEVDVRDPEIRPNFQYIAQRMMEEDCSCFVHKQQDSITLYRYFHRKKIPMWMHKLKESVWALRIRKKNETENPLQSLGRDYDTRFGKRKEETQILHRERQIQVKDEESGKLLIQYYRQYFPENRPSHEIVKKGKKMVFKVNLLNELKK